LTEYTSYAQLTLPPGSYLLEATVTLFSKSTPGKMACFIAQDTTLKGELDGGDVSAGSGEQNSLALTGALTNAATQTVEFFCKLFAGEGTVDAAHLVAIKTGSLHGSLPFD